MSQIILKVANVSTRYPLKHSGGWWHRQQWITAVNDVSFSVEQGETIGIVGESGCGKSSLAKTLVGLLQPSRGTVSLHERNIHQHGRSISKTVQMIFQDPFAALNPRMTIAESIKEPLRVQQTGLTEVELDAQVEAVMAQVGLDVQLRQRYPHEFSGGQCQRVGIARALITQPQILICDEPVSALDVSIRAQIINLLKSLQTDYDLTLIFIAHDLSIIRHISDRIFVMYMGRIVEMGETERIYQEPLHPYTRILLAAEPVADPRVERNKPLAGLQGEVPSFMHLPKGCVFQARCPNVQADCKTQTPPLSLQKQRYVACIHPHITL